VSIVAKAHVHSPGYAKLPLFVTKAHTLAVLIRRNQHVYRVPKIKIQWDMLIIDVLEHLAVQLLKQGDVSLYIIATGIM
jgi:hypothetical protein